MTTMLRRFTENQLRTAAADADRVGQAPESVLRLGAELGLGLDAVPESAGGLLEHRFSHLTRALRGFELGRGCAGLASLLECNVEPALALGQWGDPSFAQRVFAELRAGALLTMTRDAPGRLQLRNDPEPILNGNTGPVPVAAQAAHMLILGRDDTGDSVVLCLPKSAALVTPVACSGWRAGAWATWTFHDARPTQEQILKRGEDAKVAIQTITSWTHISLAARALGVASSAIAHAVAYARERKQFGQAIGEFESIIRMIDANETQIAACRLLVLQAADSLDRDMAQAAELASRARDFASDIVARATIDAVQIYGGYGFVNDYPVEKLMRDARPFEVLHGNEAFSRVLAQKAKGAH